MRRLSVLRLGATVLAVAALAACAPLSPPSALNGDDVKRQTGADRAAVREGVAPLGARLGLDEAIARALKFNLDRRVKQLEEAFALRQHEESGYDQLPKLLAAAGYTTRDQDRIARSTDSVTGLPSLANPAISSDRSHAVGSLALSWSLLDYGIARYNQAQAGDRLLAAAERRRKATHLLVQDVRVAYWRAASAQRLRDDVRASLKLAEEAMADSRQAAAERLRSPLDNLRYQRQLTENMRLLESIEQELATAKFDLALLINAPVVLNVQLVADEIPGRTDPLATPAEAMEELALAQNAELREHMYLRRVAAVEGRKVVARAYPNLSFNLGAYHDTDGYLVNPTWNEAGIQVGINLFNLLALPAQQRTAEAAVRLADQRRLAAHAAVVAQVHVAREQLAGARRQYERADALWQLDESILKQTQAREQAQAGSKLDRVAAQTTAIISLLRRYQALAQWHASISRLQATLGVDPLPGSSDTLTLEQLSGEVRQRLLNQ